MTLRIDATAMALGIVTSIVAACGSDPAPAPDLLATQQDDSGAGAESTGTGGGSSSLPDPMQMQGEASVPIGATKDAGTADVVVAKDGGAHDAAPLPLDPCIEAGTCKPGEWINVTPPSIDLTGTYRTGVRSGGLSAPSGCLCAIRTSRDLEVDGLRTDVERTDQYRQQRRKDHANRRLHQDPPHSADTPLTIYLGCVESGETGFWRSTNGGVDWTSYAVNVPGSNLTFYAPAVDPYDVKHLIMAGHLVDLLVESTDGGETWKLAAD